MHRAHLYQSKQQLYFPSAAIESESELIEALLQILLGHAIRGIRRYVSRLLSQDPIPVPVRRSALPPMPPSRLLMATASKIRRNADRVRLCPRKTSLPNAESCLRLILVLAAETHEQWLTGQRYLYGRIGVVRASEPESEAWHEVPENLRSH